ncbi:MAG: hypothetical protein JWN46_2025 [Acidimicrobiales bacterium]|nr:hypothetical protein [Acidimicrobiales bacterium]
MADSGSGAGSTSGTATDREAAAERRQTVRTLLRAGEVRGPRDLRRRLGERGYVVDDEELRGDLQAVGAVRVDGPAGPRLGLADWSRAGDERPDDPAPGSAAGVVAAVRADPDWPLQVVVVAVAAVFVLVGFLGWLIGGSSGSGGSTTDLRQPGATAPPAP